MYALQAEEKEGLLHRLVEKVKAMCADTTKSGHLDQYGLRGHDGHAIIEFLLGGNKFIDAQLMRTHCYTDMLS